MVRMLVRLFLAINILLLLSCDKVVDNLGVSSIKAIKDLVTGVDFIPLPAGEFVIGACTEVSTQGAESSCSERGNFQDDEFPAVKVEILNGIQFSTTEVPQGVVNKFLEAKNKKGLLLIKSCLDSAKVKPRELVEGEKAKFPARCLSWNDVEEYIDWLNKQETVQVTRFRYRLPTELEWEYVAKSGKESLYPWGDDVAMVGEFAWYWDNVVDTENPMFPELASLKPTLWGVYDMPGGVAEWTSDDYDPKAYEKLKTSSEEGTLIESVKSNQRTRKVVRGGSYDDSVLALRSGYRNYQRADIRSPKIGFRLVKYELSD